MAAMTRGTALVASVTRIVELTGQQDLAQLEADSELDIDAAAGLLVTASDAIYDQLEGDGVDPTLLTNATAFERAVAWHFLGLLVLRGYLPQPVALPQARSAYDFSDPYYQRVRAKFATADGDESRRPNEGIPMIGNFDPGWRFAGGAIDPLSDEYYTTRSGRRSS